MTMPMTRKDKVGQLVSYWDNQYVAMYTNSFDATGIMNQKDKWAELRFGHITPPGIVGDKVLDFGCGNGMFAPFLTRRYNEYFGLDTSMSAVNVARRYNGAFGRHFDVLSPYPTPLPFCDNSFDCVFTCTVLQHMPREMRLFYIDELKRVLQPGGFYFGVEWNGPTLGVVSNLDEDSGFNDAIWKQAWKPYNVVEDECPGHPEWRSDHVWYTKK